MVHMRAAWRRLAVEGGCLSAVETGMLWREKGKVYVVTDRVEDESRWAKRRDEPRKAGADWLMLELAK